jgi:Fic family protein
MEKSLYKIESEYLDLINQIELAEGELTPELESALQINKNELEVKSIAYVEIVKQRESLNERINEEIKRLQAMKKSNDNLIDRLKSNLLNAVNLFGNFEAGFLKFSTRKSKQVIVNCDTNELPKEFKTIKVTETPDKTAIKKAIEQGKEIQGCELVENLNLQIK